MDGVLAYKKISMKDGPEVTLEQMLQAREKRVTEQQLLLATHQKPIVSLTLVIPGSIKSASGARFLFDHALKAFTDCYAEASWPLLVREVLCAATGLEAILVLDAEAKDLKLATVKLEDEHPLGRLWDFDVICPEQGQLSRSMINVAPRRCLLCNEAAHACARSRRHSIDELLMTIEHKINMYMHLN